MEKILLLLSFFLLSCHNPNTKRDESKNISYNYKLKDTTIKAIWREWKYDPRIKDTSSIIILNEQYFKNISPPERAAIGYIATFVGSDCDWDGNPNADRSNLDCKVLKAMGLGYQCSETHLTFLRHWLRADSSLLKELDECPIIPLNAWEQNTFFDLHVRTNVDTICITYEADSANFKKKIFYHWTEDLTFKIAGDNIHLLSRQKKYGLIDR